MRTFKTFAHKTKLSETHKAKIISGLIGNILNRSQPKDEYINVAELKTVTVNGNKETIDTNTAMVAPHLATRIRASHTHPFVKSTGVNNDKDFIYNPSFWLYLSPSSGLKRAEPLVVSWCSGNHTTLQIDQGFLNAFRLSPRMTNDEILWDDLSRPKFDVVKNKLLSEYDFPNHSEAYVKVRKDYLEHYLYLRKKTAVQIFTIKRDIDLNEDILKLLNRKDHYVEEFKQYEIRICKYDHKDAIASLEINGYKLLFENDEVETEEDLPTGHYWKGIEGPVTGWRARHEMPFEYVYVSDEVLAKYEADENYQVHPNSGSVSYRNQWSVSHCERVGRNAIKIEVKKLYEGNGYEVINYWNKFSIHPSEIISGEHIPAKAERLTRKYFTFGRLLSQMTNKICNFDLSGSDIITLDEEAIEYRGWTDFSTYQPITNRVNGDFFSKEQFLSRCKKLYSLLAENIKEKSVRRIVDQLGFSLLDTEKLRGLKLLELILKYLYTAQESGLSLVNHKEEIRERTKTLKTFSILSLLFALNEIRQLDAHKSGSPKEKLYGALETLGIHPNSISNNYADACYQVYDRLIDMFSDINAFLINAIDFGSNTK